MYIYPSVRCYEHVNKVKCVFFYFQPPLYIITPTYKRPEQLAELTRLGYTLKHVSNLLWLVIEDSKTPSELVTKRLHHIAVPFIHLVGMYGLDIAACMY